MKTDTNHFIYNKEQLPVPLLNGREDLVRLYYEAWKLAFENVEYLTKKGWKPQLTCMPGSGIVWQWDSCIMTLITNYSNGTLNGFNNLDNLYRLQRKSDGWMSMAYRIDTELPAYGNRINPPLMAFAEWEHYQVTGDDSRFESVLKRLEAFYGYIEHERRRPCGLYWFEDSGSSGMDNSPRCGYPATAQNGSDVCFVDLACQQAMSAKCISLMNRKLGNLGSAEFFESEYERICDLINQFHWSDKTEFYYDCFARKNSKDKPSYINVKTGASFWALISGAASEKKAEAMKKHLMNPDEFYTEVPFPSLSKDDLNYDKDGGYWLGGVWAPTNFAAIRGLSDAGYEDFAKEITLKYLNSILNVSQNKKYGSIWELYAPEGCKPGTDESGGLCRRNFVGWSGIAPITLLIETVIGLRFFADRNTVRFHVTEEGSGLENMKFNGGLLSVKCESLSPNADETKITVQAEKPFTLQLKTPYLKEDLSVQIEPGNGTITF